MKLENGSQAVPASTSRVARIRDDPDERVTVGAAVAASTDRTGVDVGAAS
jgi:hypothetical protein